MQPTSKRRAIMPALAMALGITLVAPPACAGATSPTPVIGDALKGFAMTGFPQPLPPVTFQDDAGRVHDLAAFQGRVILVNLWATWCAPCCEEMPALDRLQAALGGPDFQVVTVSQDRGDPASVRAFLERIGAGHLPAYVDSSAGAMRAWDVFGLPATILLDREGRKLGRMTGRADWDSEDARRLIRHFISAR